MVLVSFLYGVAVIRIYYYVTNIVLFIAPEPVVILLSDDIDYDDDIDIDDRLTASYQNFSALYFFTDDGSSEPKRLMYCNREFDDEKILLQHQKAKHFKCHICHKKLFTGPGLSIHCMQVHKETIDKVPNALSNRSNIEIEIYGMEGRSYDDDDDDDEAPSDKKPKTETPSAMLPPPAMPGMMPGHGQMIHGMPPRPGMIPPPNARMMAGPMPPMMGMRPMPPMGLPPPFMPPGMMAGPMMAPGRMPMATMSTVTNTSMQAPPSKPLFPVASASNSSVSTPVGADFKPLNSTGADGSKITVSAPPKPTFPAYSGSSPSSSGEAKSTATISAESTVRKSLTTVTASGARSKIIHPDEDISLEELRAHMPKYNTAKSGAVGGVSTSAAPTSNTIGMNMMRPVLNQGMSPRGPPFAPGMMYHHHQPPGMMRPPPVNHMF
ncbi:BUB3-interacting and GLEBS motif-containing protein ZNF207 [Nymphon striatum]|nr:BUB3-interacting and GLEBS motif-containing protein ZNF207 [Nymphon striatum]